jgi:DNA invertase Pin-like site-specific DNA recombinase
MRQEQSTSQQLRQVQEFCAHYGFQLRHRFIDEAKSGGSTAGRDEFNRMMALYEHEDQRPHGLLLWNYARFARDIDDAQLNKIVIRKWGIQIHSLNDSVPEGDYGRFIEFFIDMSNEEKRKQTSVDARRGLRELVERYGCVPGTPPRGFTRERIHIGAHRDGSPRYAHKWVPDRDTSPLVLKAFQMRAAGNSLGQIHKETHLYGSINSYATFWPNKLYIGILEFGDLVIENYCTPIVPRELWDKVHEMQKKFSRFGQFNKGSLTHPRRINSRFLLSGLLRCSHCESTLYGHSSKQRNGKIMDDYSCPRAHRKRDCTRKRVPRPLIEDHVLALLRDVILHPKNLQSVRTILNAGQSERLAAQESQDKLLSRQLGKIRRQITNVTDAIAERKHSPALLKRLAELEAQENELTQKQTDLALTALHPLPEIPPAVLQRILEEIKTTLTSGTYEQKRTILRGLIDHIDIRKEPDGLHGKLWYYYPPESTPPTPSTNGPAVSTRRSPVGAQSKTAFIAVFCFP